MKECKTPGAIYSTRVTPDQSYVVITHPFDMSINKEMAKELEQEMHDAMEKIFAKFYK